MSAIFAFVSFVIFVVQLFSADFTTKGTKITKASQGLGRHPKAIERHARGMIEDGEPLPESCTLDVYCDTVDVV